LEPNQAIFQASKADAGAISIAFFSQVARAVGGDAARRPRAVAGDDIGSET
jgi:hypothetical protein